MSPPEWADRFLEWFCDTSQIEEIRGDVYELFHQRALTDGLRLARLAFLWDILRYFRPSNFKYNPFSALRTHNIMFRSYLKIAYRSLWKNWSSSLINISGLTLSVGCAVTTFLFADFFFNLNTFHQKRDRIYQVVSHINENGQERLYGPSPTVLKDKLGSEHPAVERTTAIQYATGNVKFGKNVFQERILFADNDFLEIFDFALDMGDKSVFGVNQILLDQDLRKKYFGDVDPMGKEVSIKFESGISQSFTVSGIFEPVPINNSFRPKIMIHAKHLERITGIRKNWIDETKATFVSLRKDQNAPESLLQLLKSYQQTQNEAKPESPVLRYELMSLDELSTRAGQIQERAIYGNDASGTMGIAIVGGLLLLFACLNYVNIALASATKRLKEIGIRKVMGSSRVNIITQFLIENFLLCAIALVLGVLSAYFFLLPGFNMVSPVAIPFSFSSPQVAISYFVILFLSLGILSGSYPAFYISTLQTLDTFKGESHLSGKNRLSRILLTFQFFLAFFTVLACFIFTDNAQYVKSLGWGYDPSEVLAVSAKGEHLRAFQDEFQDQSDVVAISTSKGHIGTGNHLIDFQYLDQQFKVLHYDVSATYLGTMGVGLVEGQGFKPNGDAKSVIVNQLFADQMNWPDPVGKNFIFDGEHRTVIGLIANLNHVFFDQDILRPMVFTSEELHHDHLVIKARSGTLQEVDILVQEKWHELIPEDPYARHIQADIFDAHYRNVDANTLFMLTTSFMTILLSCLGLYGLLSFTMQKRIKEFSIRKVLGASGGDIIRLANQEFLLILIIAFGLGAPLSIWLMQKAVAFVFSVSKPFSILPILLCILIMAFTIGLTVFGQIRKVIMVNPANTLRRE